MNTEDSIKECDRKLFCALRDSNKWLKPYQLGLKCGISRTTASTKCRALEKLGLVERRTVEETDGTGFPTKSVEWRVIQRNGRQRD